MEHKCTREELQKWLNQGLSCREIGEKVGVHGKTIGKWAKKWGLKTMPPGGRNLIDITGKDLAN